MSGTEKSKNESDKVNADTSVPPPTETESQNKSPTDATNLTPPSKSELADKSTELQPEEPPATPEPSNPTVSHWHRFWTFFAKVAGAVFATGSTLLFLLALWDSYRPKITITPGGTLNAKNPFATIFIMQNEGLLPISHVTYLTKLSAIDISNQTQIISAEQNVMVIPKMENLESYSLGIRYPAVQLGLHDSVETTNHANPLNSTNIFNPTNAITKQINITTFILSFDVTYDPEFSKIFGKRTDTLYFFGVPDMDMNWQWFPSAHQPITAQTIDTNLLAQIQKMNAPIATPTNGGGLIHTNQAKSH